MELAFRNKFDRVLTNTKRIQCNCYRMCTSECTSVEIILSECKILILKQLLVNHTKYILFHVFCRRLSDGVSAFFSNL